MINAWWLLWFQEQYSWSMRIGLLTLTIVMSEKFLLMEIPATEEVAHVVILTPLMVFIIVQLFTMTPSKGSLLEYFSKLSYAYSMTWLTYYISDFYSFTSISKWDAIVSCCYLRFQDWDPNWSTNMYSICVGTIFCAIMLTPWNVRGCFILGCWHESFCYWMMLFSSQLNW